LFVFYCSHQLTQNKFKEIESIEQKAVRNVSIFHVCAAARAEATLGRRTERTGDNSNGLLGTDNNNRRAKGVETE